MPAPPGLSLHLAGPLAVSVDANGLVRALRRTRRWLVRVTSGGPPEIAGGSTAGPER